MGYNQIVGTGQMIDAAIALLHKMLGGIRSWCGIIKYDFGGCQLLAYSVELYDRDIFIQQMLEITDISGFLGQRDDETVYHVLLKCADVFQFFVCWLFRGHDENLIAVFVHDPLDGHNDFWEKGVYKFRYDDSYQWWFMLGQPLGDRVGRIAHFLGFLKNHVFSIRVYVVFVVESSGYCGYGYI